MGWYSMHGYSRRDVIAMLTKSEDFLTGDIYKRRTTLRHCLRGNVLWSLIEYLKIDCGSGKVERLNVIGCDLLQSFAEGWGHKPMDESFGPCYYSCPLSYLELAPAQDENWREQVRIHHARRKGAVA